MRSLKLKKAINKVYAIVGTALVVVGGFAFYALADLSQNKPYSVVTNDEIKAKAQPTIFYFESKDKSVNLATNIYLKNFKADGVFFIKHNNESKEVDLEKDAEIGVKVDLGKYNLEDPFFKIETINIEKSGTNLASLNVYVINDLAPAKKKDLDNNNETDLIAPYFIITSQEEDEFILWTLDNISNVSFNPEAPLKVKEVNTETVTFNSKEWKKLTIDYSVKESVVRNKVYDIKIKANINNNTVEIPVKFVKTNSLEDLEEKYDYTFDEIGRIG